MSKNSLKSKEQLKELIKMGKSDRGGYSKAQLAVFGVPWIGKKGVSPDPWIDSLLETWENVKTEQIVEFLSLKDKHLSSERSIRKNPERAKNQIKDGFRFNKKWHVRTATTIPW